MGLRGVGQVEPYGFLYVFLGDGVGQVEPPGFFVMCVFLWGGGGCRVSGIVGLLCMFFWDAGSVEP